MAFSVSKVSGVPVEGAPATELPQDSASSKPGGELYPVPPDNSVSANQIDPKTKLPNYLGPKLHVPSSIAAGDTITNNVPGDPTDNDNNLP